MDENVQLLIWAATIYLFAAAFSLDPTIYIQSLTIYGGVLFAAIIAASCDWNKEK